jgi:hypothetical protein
VAAAISRRLWTLGRHRAFAGAKEPAIQRSLIPLGRPMNRDDEYVTYARSKNGLRYAAD